MRLWDFWKWFQIAAVAQQRTKAIIPGSPSLLLRQLLSFLYLNTNSLQVARDTGGLNAETWEIFVPWLQHGVPLCLSSVLQETGNKPFPRSWCLGYERLRGLLAEHFSLPNLNHMCSAGHTHARLPTVTSVTCTCLNLINRANKLNARGLSPNISTGTAQWGGRWEVMVPLALTAPPGSTADWEEDALSSVTNFWAVKPHHSLEYYHVPFPFTLETQTTATKTNKSVRGVMWCSLKQIVDKVKHLPPS